jgi:AGZA family xanthine/uracil permease-like MFS transporter
MPLAAVSAATCIAAALGTLLMGTFARYPIALAPGMGLNAYFTYSVVKGMGEAAYPLAFLLLIRFIYMGSRL